MPVSFKHKLCFIHIPKTAGTTIEAALDMHHENAFFVKKKYKDYKVTPQHLTLTELSNELNLSEYKIFTIVRNPFDRIVSEFVYQKECKVTKEYHDLSFEEFVQVCLSLNEEKRKWIFDGHLEPQVDFIRGNFSTRIFKYENLKECFDWLKQTTKENLNFGHERKSVRNNYRDYYETENAIRIVENFYRMDLDFFDYTF